ncbi:MAG TPA: hypothetical protein VNL38_03375 [Candidatus Nitrosotenuis sp.]|nr:hypothetical protein [Candidatus Nitrosotenuis sp.]
MKAIRIGAFFLLALLGSAWLTADATAQKKDYLTSVEADKIRDAETPSEKIKLLLTFAADRLKKFQYELSRPVSDRRRVERLNSLLNAYSACVDDAADIIAVALEKQQDAHAGIKELQTRGKDFLATLEKLASGGPEFASYEETLKDAIEATRDAMRDAEEAAKELAPPPVRRKP